MARWAMPPSAMTTESGGSVLQFVRKKCVAGIDLRTDRLVVGRQALHGVGDAAVDQLEAIVSRFRMLARAETVLMQHLVQQDAGMIAGKRPARCDSPVHARRQSDYQEARVRRRRTAAPGRQ